ncbi:Uncharacterised protein [Vibrio cholerae]|nr:Uncharacterised protein [Vibrio cholerae]
MRSIPIRLIAKVTADLHTSLTVIQRDSSTMLACSIRTFCSCFLRI